MTDVLIGLSAMFAAAAIGLISAVGLLVWWSGGEKRDWVCPQVRENLNQAKKPLSNRASNHS